MSDDVDHIKERKKEFQRALRSRMTPNLRRTLAVFDVIMVVTVLVDLAFMMGYIGDAILQPLVVVNLITVAIGYTSMTAKRRLGKQVSKEMQREWGDPDSEGVEILVDEDSEEDATSSE